MTIIKKGERQGKEEFKEEEINMNSTSLALKNKMLIQNQLKTNLMKILSLSGIDESSIDEELKYKINSWKNTTYPYQDIERFTIPMLSTINAGKSTTLNFLLHFDNNLLQIGEKVTTKFCVIIRHNKKLKRGKIYNVTIKRRADINKYNFHKAEEIKEDIKTFIAKRNTILEEMKDQEIKDTSLYFIIMEIDTGLFEGEYEQYSHLVEFIDILG